MDHLTKLEEMLNQANLEIKNGKYEVLLSTLRKYHDLKVLLDKAVTIPRITLSTMYNEYAIMFEQQSNLDIAIKHYKKCAMSTLDKNVLTRAKESIERYKIKKELR
ncbi:MAG: ribosomal protein L5 [Patescibacteria group bacterium]|jgi:ribosomal protein L5